MNNITLDECFQFGLGAFETIGIEQGIPILLEKHLKRLERAADFVGSQPGGSKNIWKNKKNARRCRKNLMDWNTVR
jgi:branched-subunit amino acid aminotransferase/4-amino-4-deoxychorismate lyase